MTETALLNISFNFYVALMMIMKRTASTIENACCVFLCVQLSTQVLANTQFASHVSVNTPARSFTHGVGDPISTLARRSYPVQMHFGNFRRPPYEQPRPRGAGGGYPRERPSIPFNNEDVRHGNSLGGATWPQLYNSYMDVSIPVLPLSPYKVDSPDPESLWPEGLFLPPISSPRFGHSIARSDTDTDEPIDPYLLEGSEAIAAVTRANRHGELYFHEIPHIESLLVNQELRTRNKLKPHRLGSIRHTWPYYRP